jgi:hypothetical protein
VASGLLDCRRDALSSFDSKKAYLQATLGRELFDGLNDLYAERIAGVAEYSHGTQAWNAFLQQLERLSSKGLVPRR